MSQPGAPSQGKDGSGSGPPTHSVPVDDAHYYRTPQDHLRHEQQQQQHARDANVVNLQSPPSPDDFSLIGATRRSTSTSGNNSRLITPTSATSPVFGRRSHHTSDRHHHHHNNNNSSGGSGSGPAASSPLSAGFSPTTAAGGGVGGSGGVRRQMDGLGRRSVPRASSQVALPRFARHGRRAGSGGPVLQPHRHQPLYYPQQQRHLRQSSSSASRHSSRSGGRHHHHPPPSAAQHHRSATSPADSSSSSSHSTPVQPSLYGSTGLFATGGRHATLPYGNAAAAAAAGHHVPHSAYIPTFVGKTPSVASPTSTVDSRGSARAMPHGSAQRQHRQRRGNTVGMTASAQAWHRGATTSATAAAAAAAAAGGAHSTSSSFASSSHRRHAHHHHQQQQGTHRHRHTRSSTSGDGDDEGHTTSVVERGGRQPLPGYTPDITRVASHGANTVSTRTDSPSSTAVSSPATSGAPSRITPTSSPVHGDERYAFPLPQQYQQQQQRRGMPRVDSNATLTSTTTAATTPVSSLRDNASFGIGGANPSSAAAAVGVAGLTAAGSGAGRRAAASGTTSASEYGSPTSMSTPPVVTPTTEFERSLAHLPTDERSNVAWARRASALGVGGGGGLQTGMYGESPIAVSTGAVTTPEKLPLPSPHIPAMELMAGVGGKETSSPSLAASSPSAGEGGSAVVVVMEDSRPASAPAPQTEYQQQQQNYYAQAQQHFTSLPSHMGGTGHAAPLTRSFARPVSPLQYRGVESNAEHEDASTGGDDGAAVSRRPPPPPPPPLPPLHPHSQDSDPRAETAPASASPGVVAGVGAGVGDDADRQHHQRLGRSADEARDHDAMQFRSGDGGAAGFLRVSSFGSGEESSLYSLNHSNAESRSVSPRPWEEHVGGLMDRAYTSTEAQMALHQRRIEEARMQEALHSLGIHTGGAAATAASDGMLRDGLQARQEGPAGAGALRTEAGMPPWQQQQQQQPSSSSLHGQSLPSHQSAGGSRYATPRFATANNQASMGSEQSAVQVPVYATAADALMDWGRAYATGQPGTTSGATAAAAAVAEYTVRGGSAVGVNTSTNNNSHASPASVGVAGEAVSAGGPHTVGADGLTDAAPRPSAPPLTTVAETSVIRGETNGGGAAAGPAIAAVRSTVVSSSSNNTSGGGVGAGAFSGPTLFRSSTAPSAVASMAQDSATQSSSRISGGSVVGGGLYHRSGALGSSPVVGATGAAYLLPDTLFSTSPTNAASADRLVGATATAAAPTTATGNTAAAAAGVSRRPAASTTQLGNQPANLNASMANMNGSSLFYFNNSFSGSIRDPLAASVVMQQNRTALVAELKRRRQRLQKQLGLLQREATARNIFALVRASNAAQVQYLLQEGLSNVNDRDYNGCTPLHVAAGEGNQAIVRVLLSFGADVLAVDHSGRTALDCAAANRHSGVGRYLLTIIRNKHLAQDANSGTDDGTGAITTGAEGEGEEGAGTQSDADGGLFRGEERRSTTTAAAAAPAGAVFSSAASSPPAAGPAAAVGVKAAGGALGKGGVPALSAGRLGVDVPRPGELRRYGSGCVNMPDLLMGGSFAAWPPTPAHRSAAVASSGSSATRSPALPLAPTPPNVSTSSLTDSAVFFRSQPPLSPSATTQLQQQQQQQQSAQMGRSLTPSSPSSPKSPRGSHAERRSTLAHLDSASDSELPPSAAGWPGRNAQAVLTGGYESTAKQRIHNEGSSSYNSGGVGGVKDDVRGAEAQASTVPAAPSSAAAATKKTLLTADYTAFDDTDKPSPASSLTAATAATNNNNDNAAAAAADAAQLPQWRRNSTPHGSSPMRPVVLSALHTSAAARSRVLIAAESSMSSLPAAAGAAASVPSTADSPHATWSTSTPPTAMTASALGDGRSGSPGMRPMLPPSTANARNSQQTSVTASAAASSTSVPPSTTAAATAAAAAAAALLAVSGGGSTANAGLASNPSTLSLGRSLTSGPPSPSTAVHAANAHSSSFNSSSQLAYRGVGGGQLHTGLLPLKETRRSLGRAGTPLSQPQNVLSDAERSCTTPVMLRDRPIVSAPPYLAGGTDTPVSESVHGEDGDGRHLAAGTAHLYHSSINNQRSGTAHAAAAAAAARSPPAVAAGGNNDGYGMRSVSSSSSSHYKAARQQLPSSIPSTSFDGVYQRTPPPVSILRAAAADDDDDDGTTATGSGTERAEEENMELDEAELQSVLLGRREVCARQQQQQQQQRGQRIEDTASADDDDDGKNNKRTANAAGATSLSPVRTTLTRGDGAAAGPATRMAEAGDDAHYEYHDDGGERAPSLRKQQQQQEHRQPFHHVPYPQQDGSLATTVSAGTEERGGSVVSTRDVAAAAAALGATPGTRMLRPIKLLPLDEEKERQLHRHATDGTPLEVPFYSKAKSNVAGVAVEEEEEEEAVVAKGMKPADSDLFSNATTSAPSSAALGSNAGGAGMGGGVHAGGRWLHPTYASSASPFPPFGLKSLDDTPPLSTDASGTGSPLTGHHNFRSSTRESLSACDVGQQSVDEHHHHFRLATTTGAAPLLQAGRDAATAMPTTTAFISAAAATTATPTTSAAAGSSAAVVPTMRMATHVDTAVATAKQGEFGSGGGGADTTQASPRVDAGEPVRSDAGSVNVDTTRAATTALTAASAAPVTPAAAGKQAITTTAATAPSPVYGGDSTASAHLVQQARLLQRCGRHAMEEQSFLEEAQHEPIDLATLHHSSYTTVCDTVSIIVCMVGLPGRGKSFIGKRLVRYMNWKGVPCKVFNAGNYRRQLLGVEGTAGADFFDPNNPKGAQLREKMAELACEDLVSFIASHSLAVGILDATNTTRKRRAWLAEYFQQEAERRGVPYRLLFIESVCTDDTIITENILRSKCDNDDFKNVSDVGAIIAEFRSRIVQYEKVYETCEPAERMPYIKIINVKHHVILHHVPNGLGSRIAFFLLNLHPIAFPIYVALPGETVGDKKHVYGGEERLTARGEAYAVALKNFIQDRYVPHMVVLHATNYSVLSTLAPLMDGATEDEAALFLQVPAGGGGGGGGNGGGGGAGGGVTVTTHPATAAAAAAAAAVAGGSAGKGASPARQTSHKPTRRRQRQQQQQQQQQQKQKPPALPLSTPSSSAIVASSTNTSQHATATASPTSFVAASGSVPVVVASPTTAAAVPSLPSAAAAAAAARRTSRVGEDERPDPLSPAQQRAPAYPSVSYTAGGTVTDVGSPSVSTHDDSGGKAQSSHSLQSLGKTEKEGDGDGKRHRHRRSRHSSIASSGGNGGRRALPGTEGPVTRLHPYSPTTSIEELKAMAGGDLSVVPLPVLRAVASANSTGESGSRQNSTERQRRHHHHHHHHHHHDQHRDYSISVSTASKMEERVSSSAATVESRTPRTTSVSNEHGIIGMEKISGTEDERDDHDGECSEDRTNTTVEKKKKRMGRRDGSNSGSNSRSSSSSSDADETRSNASSPNTSSSSSSSSDNEEEMCDEVLCPVPGLDNINFGRFSGHTAAWVKEKYPRLSAMLYDVDDRSIGAMGATTASSSAAAGSGAGSGGAAEQPTQLLPLHNTKGAAEGQQESSNGASAAAAVSATRPSKDCSSAAAGAAAPKATPESLPPPSLREQGSPNSPNTSSGDWQQHGGTTLLPPPVHYATHEEAIAQLQHAPTGADPRLSYCIQFPNGESCRQVNVRLEPALMAVMRTQSPVFVVAPPVPAQGILSFFMDVIPELSPTIRIPAGCVVEIGVKDGITVHPLLPDALPAYMNRSPLTVMPELQEAMAEHGGAGGDCGGAVVKDHRE